MDLATGLASRGCEVTVVGCGLHRQRRRREPWGDSVSLRTLSHYLRWTPGLWRLRKSRVLRYGDPRWFAASQAEAIARFIRRRRGRYDLIEATNYEGPSHRVPASEPVVVRLSSPSHFMAPDKPLKEFEAEACRRARLVIANSHGSAAFCRELYAPLQTPIRVVHHGIPDADPGDAAPDGRPLRLAYVGQAQLRKGTDTLIRAIAALPPDCGDFTLDFVRADIDDLVRDNPELAPVWRQVRDRFGDRITSLGLLSEGDKQSLLCRTDIVVAPSRFESFGLVAAEAMRAGATVLAAAAGGLAEVVEAGPQNELVRPGDPAALARSLASMIGEGPARFRRARPQQRAAFLDHFHVDRMVDQSLTLYQDVLAGRVGGAQSNPVLNGATP